MTPGVFSRPERLADGSTLAGFESGVAVVDDYARNRAHKARRNGTAVVYVSYCGSDPAGFYTLSPFSIEREETRGWLARNSPASIPVILLGMLGVSSRFQGQGLGPQLLKDAVKRSLAAADVIGGKALVVDPVDERVSEFYRKYGFQGIPGSSRMYLRLT